MTIAPGQRLGPYEITAKLGEGGMGEVWRATDTRLKREVAIKVLPAAFTEDRERLARFEREAQLLAQLHHSNIASIYGLEESGGVRALVMELVEGPTLAERLESGHLPLDETLAIARQIAEALEEAHEKGIIHRDLKPQNIKAPVDGKVKVLDFGLAKAMDTGSAAGMSPHDLAHSPTVTFGGTREGIILGTAAYMAPEQARGGAIDRRADIWSFGVVLYEMLADERLFAEGSVVDTLSAVMRKPIDLGRLPATTPSALRVLLARCLERDPKRRLRDIGEARFALEVLVAGGGAASERAAAPARPSRRIIFAVGLASMLVGALLGVAFLGSPRHPAEPEPIHVHALTYSGSDSDPSASPDGKLVAFTSWRDGVARIWIKQLAGGGEAPLTSGPDGLARFSPDGSSLLFVHDLGTAQAVQRIGLVGGEPRRLLDNAAAADWSPDGQRIVFVRGGTALFQRSQVGVLEIASGRETILADEGNRIVHSPRWSPDGGRIAFGSGGFSDADWQIRSLDPASGRSSEICPLPVGYQIGGIAWSGSGSSLFFIQSTSLMGDFTGTGSRVLRCDLDAGARRTLFWGDGLVWTTSSASEITHADVLAPGRLVFSQRLRRQKLREVTLGASADARILADVSSIDRQPVYSPDGRSILFSSNRGGNLDLWTIDRATGAVRQVTDDPAQDWDPAFTADGKQILWSSDRGSGHLEVWSSNADGSGAGQVTRDGISAQNPTATPDGRWIVYWSGNPQHYGVWKTRPDGSQSTQLLKGAAIQTELSPDGRYVLFVEQDRLNLRNTIRVLEVESGRVVPYAIDVRFTISGPPIIWGRARWARDGQAIYFVGQNEHGLSGIYQQDFAASRDTASTRRPVAGFSRDYVTESLGLSADGSLLALSTGQDVASIQVADGVPGALPPVRKAP